MTLKQDSVHLLFVLYWVICCLNQGIYYRIFLSQTGSGFQTLSGSAIPKYWSSTPPPPHHQVFQELVPFVRVAA